MLDCTVCAALRCFSLYCTVLVCAGTALQHWVISILLCRCCWHVPARVLSDSSSPAGAGRCCKGARGCVAASSRQLQWRAAGLHSSICRRVAAAVWRPAKADHLQVSWGCMVGKAATRAVLDLWLCGKAVALIANGDVETLALQRASLQCRWQQLHCRPEIRQ